MLRCLVKNRNLVAGGGAVEAELALRLGQRAKEIGGVDGYCLQVCFKDLVSTLKTPYKRYAEAMEVIPYTLAENAALNPIEVVTELRKRHNAGEMHTGINVRKVCFRSARICTYKPNRPAFPTWLRRKCSSRFWSPRRC